jgi:hypothetical protein
MHAIHPIDTGLERLKPTPYALKILRETAIFSRSCRRFFRKSLIHTNLFGYRGWGVLLPLTDGPKPRKLYAAHNAILRGCLIAGNQTFLKRQKERARQEKQAAKAQLKAERRAGGVQTTAEDNTPEEVDPDDPYAQPKGLDFHDF